MESTQKALEQFASAMSEYAGHLRSHTSAIQGLSEASHELKNGAAVQNEVLIRLVETMEQGVPKKEQVIPKIEQVIPKIEQVVPKMEQVIPKQVKEEVAPEAEKIKFPPGCIRSHQGHIEEEEIRRAG